MEIAVTLKFFKDRPDLRVGLAGHTAPKTTAIWRQTIVDETALV